jgi:hypothetical protein
MKKKKRGLALFEVIGKGKNPKRNDGSLSIPPWLGGQSAGRDEPNIGQSRLPDNLPEAPEDYPQGERGDRFGSEPPKPYMPKKRLLDFGNGRFNLSLPTSWLGIFGLALATVMVAAYVVGFHIGRYGSTPSGRIADNGENLTLEKLRDSEPRGDVLVVDESRQSKLKSRVVQTTAKKPSTKPSTGGDALRTSGYNYLLIESFMTREDANRAAAFLNENAVPVTVEYWPKSKVYVVKGLKGFEKVSSDESARYVANVMKLGKIYVRNGGNSSFANCYFRKEQ